MGMSASASIWVGITTENIEHDLDVLIHHEENEVVKWGWEGQYEAECVYRFDHYIGWGIVVTHISQYDGVSLFDMQTGKKCIKVKQLMVKSLQAKGLNADYVDVYCNADFS